MGKSTHQKLTARIHDYRLHGPLVLPHRVFLEKSRLSDSVFSSICWFLVDRYIYIYRCTVSSFAGEVLPL